MKSPFPGMDPYLEGEVWREVHNALAFKIQKRLLSEIRQKYNVRLDIYTVKDNAPQSDVGIMYPDVGVFNHKVEEPAIAYGNKKNATPPNITVPILPTYEVNIPSILIRTKSDNKLVTAIEILSPVNKRKPGIAAYLKKKQRLIEEGVHFLEIDFIRRGARTISIENMEEIDYLVGLTRKDSYKTDVWTMTIDSILPIVPIPLIAPDKDVLIDLQEMMDEIYEDSAFGNWINYNENPLPPFLPEEKYGKYTSKVTIK